MAWVGTPPRTSSMTWKSSLHAFGGEVLCLHLIFATFLKLVSFLVHGDPQPLRGSVCLPQR